MEKQKKEEPQQKSESKENSLRIAALLNKATQHLKNMGSQSK